MPLVKSVTKWWREIAKVMKSSFYTTERPSCASVVLRQLALLDDCVRECLSTSVLVATLDSRDMSA